MPWLVGEVPGPENKMVVSEDDSDEEVTAPWRFLDNIGGIRVDVSKSAREG